MGTEPPNEPPRTKRTDVGYKRPPVETQFKKGQKPPPPQEARSAAAKRDRDAHENSPRGAPRDT